MTGRPMILGLAIALAAAVGAPGATAAPKAPAAKPAPAPAVYRMQALLAQDLAWYDESRLAFFGNRAAGEPVGVYVWDPVKNQLSRLTEGPADLHSLAATRGRVAFVQRGSGMAPAPAPNASGEVPIDLPQPGPEVLWVQAPGTVKFQAAFRGWVLPGSVAWSPTGERLAFITRDMRGIHRLALLTPGMAPVLVSLDQDYEMTGLVGWISAQDVLLRTKPLIGGADRLLQVGKGGIEHLLDGNAPRVSPDGRFLLVKDWAGAGAYLRTLKGEGRAIHPQANAYDWSPKGDGIVLAIGRDVLAVDAAGKVRRHWPQVAAIGVGGLKVSPDGRFVALNQDYGLAVLPLR